MRYGDLGPLRQALAEATRTDESNAESTIERFVELPPGLQDALEARRHHLLTGRRGTGKSTLLHVAREALRRNGVPVAVIDMERYKGRPFPDVLIEILIRLLDEVRPQIRGRSAWKGLQLRRRFNKSRKELVMLLDDPQAVTRKVERSHNKSRTRKIGAGVKGEGYGATASLAGDASAAKGFSSMTSAEYEEMKIERLQTIAHRLSTELTSLVTGAAQNKAVIFVDDFYYVRLSDQPEVLNYLHQVIKSTGIWLKVGGVGARMRPFRDGDPPIGMQPHQDIDPLSIDVTLNEFATAQRFLELMLDGVAQKIGITASKLITDTARSRLVLACGGAVARDYLTLTSLSLDAAVERISGSTAPTADTLVSIQAEDVNVAAKKRMNLKELELDLDAGSDAVALRARWRDVCDFAREQGNIAFVLIRQSDIDQAEWGDQIRQLENLRLLHRIRDTIPNAPKWRGVKTDVFLVDLGQVANRRLRSAIPEFWQSTREFDRLRRAEWVYAPSWREKLAEKHTGKSGRSAPRPDEESLDDGEPMEAFTLFDDPADIT